MESISEVLSRYVERRDNFRARYKARNSGLVPASASAGGPLAFNELINEHAKALARSLPDLSLAEWEALSELSSSYLNWRRMYDRSN